MSGCPYLRIRAPAPGGAAAGQRGGAVAAPISSEMRSGPEGNARPANETTP